MGRRKDRFWGYVVELKDGFICNFCKRKFSGAIPRIKSHLSGVRRRGIDICDEVPENVRAAALSEIGGPCKISKTIVTSDNLKADQATSTSADNFSKKREKFKSMVDNKLTKFITLNSIPLDVVEARSFTDFVSSAVEFGPDYKLPSTLALKTKLIPDLNMEVDAYLKNVRESWDNTGCTIMVGIYSNFIIVSASSPKGLVFVNLYDMPKSDTDLQDLVSSVIEDIGADRVVQVIAKDDEMCSKFKNLMISKYPRICMISCVAHKILIVLHRICYDVPWIQAIIDDAKLIVEYMHEDGAVLSMMRKYTNNRELKHISCTNKVSHYQMLRSVFDNKDELSQLVSSAEWRALDYSNTERAVKVADTIQRNEFWSQGQGVLKILESIIQVLHLVEDDRATSGYLYEAMNKAKCAILQQYNVNKGKNELIKKIFEEGETDIIHPVHAVAAFLNPAYMFRNNFIVDKNMSNGICFVWKNFVSNEEKKDFTKEVHRYRNQMSELFTEIGKEMIETSHPWVWWDFCGTCLPVLRKYAMRILSQCCKCSSELKCTAIDVAHTKDISGAAPNIFKIENTIMMEKFKSLEVQSLEPIDLLLCNELNVDAYQANKADSAKQFIGDEDSAANCAINKLSCSGENDSSSISAVSVDFDQFFSRLDQLNKYFNFPSLEVVL